MKIKATELSAGKRKRHLIADDETLVVREIDPTSDGKLRRFILLDRRGRSVGIFYEDELPERVLA